MAGRTPTEAFVEFIAPIQQALGLLTVVTLIVGFFSDMVVTAVLLRIGLDWRTGTDSPSSGATAAAAA